MSIVWMILIGLVAGAIAKLIMPGKDPGGIIVTIIIGIVGSIVGGFLLGLVSGDRGFGPTGIIGSILGALLVLWIYRKFATRSTTV